MNNKKVMLFKEAAVKSFQLLLALVKKKLNLLALIPGKKRSRQIVVWVLRWGLTLVWTGPVKSKVRQSFLSQGKNPLCITQWLWCKDDYLHVVTPQKNPGGPNNFPERVDVHPFPASDGLWAQQVQQLLPCSSPQRFCLEKKPKQQALLVILPGISWKMRQLEMEKLKLNSSDADI